MKNAPLVIEWGKFLPTDDDAPAPDLVVVTSGNPSPGEDNSLSDQSDHQLRDKITRIRNMLGDGSLLHKLHDNGAKLLQNLGHLEEELRQRDFVRIRKDAGEFERASSTMEEKSSDLVGECCSSSAISKSHSMSSFAFQFSKKLEDAPFREELRYISRSMPQKLKRKWPKGHGDKHSTFFSSQNAKTSSREQPFHCLPVKKKYMSSKVGHKRIQSPRKSSLQEERNSASEILKRRRASGSWKSKSKKVEDVVILDEDTQPAEIIGETTSSKWKETKIYYPSRDDPEAVELCYSDIKCLDPESYLTSTIMNFYIQYIQRSFASTCRPRGEYYIFNTYFYEKLKEAALCKGDKNASFQKLRRWLKGANIFQKSYIFLPIHGNLHWSLVIICIPAKEDGSGPIILHLDSLGMHTSNLIFDIVESYLRDEWSFMYENAATLDLPFSEGVWRNFPRRIEKKEITVPQQKNDYDCGLFVLYYMERFIREAPERIRSKDLYMFGAKWFRPEEASSLRKRIRELLTEELESARLETGERSPASFGSSEDSIRQLSDSGN